MSTENTPQDEQARADILAEQLADEAEREENEDEQASEEDLLAWRAEPCEQDGSSPTVAADGDGRRLCAGCATKAELTGDSTAWDDDAPQGAQLPYSRPDLAELAAASYAACDHATACACLAQLGHAVAAELGISEGAGTLVAGRLWDVIDPFGNAGHVSEHKQDGPAHAAYRVSWTDEVTETHTRVFTAAELTAMGVDFEPTRGDMGEFTDDLAGFEGQAGTSTASTVDERYITGVGLAVAPAAVPAPEQGTCVSCGAVRPAAQLEVINPAGNRACKATEACGLRGLGLLPGEYLVAVARAVGAELDALSAAELAALVVVLVPVASRANLALAAREHGQEALAQARLDYAPRTAQQG